jgi:hypothetical protein
MHHYLRFTNYLLIFLQFLGNVNFDFAKLIVQTPRLGIAL